MMYSVIRPLLFAFDPESAHALALRGLQYLPEIVFPKPAQKPVEAMGLTFPHPIGLAAGLDKNGAHLTALSKLGCSFIEIGTVTPKPQLGQEKPRVFRLPAANALINRMGFNNVGVDGVIANLERSTYRGILGINIGKNKATPLQQAVNDYLICLQRLYPYASYMTINISSPNTPELRQLQQHGYFYDLIKALTKARAQLADQTDRYVPLVVKVSPDESDETLKQLTDVVLACRIDGLVATNTTTARDTVAFLPHGQETGGLSGRPVQAASTRTLARLKTYVGDALTLIGAGGIDGPEALREKKNAGAQLCQVYTGLIYQGPGLVKQLVSAW